LWLAKAAFPSAVSALMRQKRATVAAEKIQVMCRTPILADDQ
jgi:hypothetical protein